MILFLKGCLYLTLLYWVTDETGPVTIALLVLVLVELFIHDDRIAQISHAWDAHQRELRRHLEKYEREEL